MTTRRKDLRTGMSVWQAGRAPAIATKRLDRDIKCDVLVIGAGISGALVAELLSADHHDVVIVDRRGPFKGSTAANTGLILYEIDTPLIHLIRKIGEADAMRAWRRSFLAVYALVARTRSLGIACGLAGRRNLYLSGKVLDASNLRREAEARAAAGFDTTYLAGAALGERYGVAASGALLSEGSFEVDPRRLTAGYLRAAISRGARVYGADVVSVDAGARTVHALTARGPSIKCRHLVFATGYEVPRGVSTKKHQLASTYAIATKRQSRRLWPGRSLIWEASQPYLYLRTTEDGRIIAGGEDEEVSDAEARDQMLPRKSNEFARSSDVSFPASIRNRIFNGRELSA